MTDIRELLREATDDLALADRDPVTRIREAAARRRRTTLAVAATVVVVIAAIALPLSLNGSRSSPPSASHTPRPPRHQIAQTWALDDGSVATGFGTLWGVKCCGGSIKPSWVDELALSTGRRIARIRVPGPTATVATGAGRVWTIGATDGGPSAVSVVDPRTLDVSTLRLPNVHAEPYDIAFANGSAWVTFDVLDQVWRLTPTERGIQKSVVAVSGSPQGIATTDSGALWVQRSVTNGGVLTRMRVTSHSAHLGQSVPWRGDIYSAAGRRTLWASSASLRTVLALDPSNLSRCLACAQADNITIKGPQIYAAISTRRGLFVSTFGSPTTPGHTDYFSRDDLRADRETPTARISGGGQLAPDGAGVVIGAGTAGLIHWVPIR